MTESELQIAVADYLVRRYPNVMFHSDFGSGIKMTKGQAIKQKRQNGGRRGWPDMFIAKPMFVATISSPERYGLFLELKREGTKLKKKDGSWANEHIAEQHEVLAGLNALGYAAEFAVGFKEARRIIDEYLRGKEDV